MTNQETQVQILASGGLDSTACIAYYLRRGYKVELLWVNYGQKAARMERLAVRRIAKFYEAPLQIIALKDMTWKFPNGSDEYPGRNAIMSLLGAASLREGNGLVAMGIHSGTNYVDCSQEFQHQIADLIGLLFRGLIAVDFPFGQWQKQQIAQFCVQYDVPIKLTYSCLSGSNPPCGKCESCVERQKLGYILDNI